MENLKKKCSLILVGMSLGIPAILTGQTGSVHELSSFPVYTGAYLESAKAVATQVGDRMRREVRVDMLSRGGPGYQSDITVRGGIFEGTGMMIGGINLFDPQTGHYFSEVPLDPAFFSGAQLLTGTNNGLYGYNSTAGSVDWQWAPMNSGGRIRATVGTDGRMGSSLVGSDRAGGMDWQVGISGDRSDGSIANGDFEMKRISGRLEMEAGPGKLRIFGGHVDKVYGWPGMYTGYSTLAETEDYAVSLLGWQWESGDWLSGGKRHRHRIGGYWRQLEDDYEFNRFEPNSLFEHKTEVWSLQGDGTIHFDPLQVDYRWVLLRDRIVRSTSLLYGAFDEREYGKGALMLRRGWMLSQGEIRAYGGIGIDTTSEDETVGTPQGGLAWAGELMSGTVNIYGEYSRTSQVPGYTVLASRTTGLFGGNAELGRETAETVEAGIKYQRGGLSAHAVAFERRDRDLVDWVYETGTPSARQASAVDIAVRGVESGIRWEIESTALELGYAILDKDPDYLETAGDASFYALNYARHRILASIDQAFPKGIDMRLDAEYRKHPDNALRSGGDAAFYLHLHAGWEEFPAPGWTLYLDLQNLTGEDFEPLPGTPGRGREMWISVSYSW